MVWRCFEEYPGVFQGVLQGFPGPSIIVMCFFGVTGRGGSIQDALLASQEPQEDSLKTFMALMPDWIKNPLKRL